MSSVTIADMHKIVTANGLVPIPVDIEIASLAPRTELLALALTPKTRVLVIAQLMGTRVDLTPYIGKKGAV